MAKKITADPTKLYALRFHGDKEASEIVMNVETEREGFSGICYLTPPDHGHMIHGQMGKQTTDGFTFIADQGGGKKHMEEWEFTEVTYDSFREKYYKIVYGGEQLAKQFHNTQDMEDYYHANFPDYT